MDHLDTTITQITSEIILLKQQTAQNIIEIGKRLTQAKEALPHGEWEAWLEKKVDFSYRSAARMMQVAREFGNLPTLAGLNQSKVFALLDVPADQREEFTSQAHEINGQQKTVDEMTTRELQQAIKEKKEAERRAQQAEAEKHQLEQRALKAEGNAEWAEKQYKQISESRWEDQNKFNEMAKKIKELEAIEPKVVEKIIEKEVVPDEILEKLERRKQDVEFWKGQSEQIHADYESIKNEHLALKAQLDNKFKGFDEQLLDFSAFKSDINTFLRKATPLIYLGDSFSKLSHKEREKYKEQIELVELWLDDIKAALGGSKGGANMVIIQGGEQ